MCTHSYLALHLAIWVQMQDYIVGCKGPTLIALNTVGVAEINTAHLEEAVAAFRVPHLT